MTSKTITLPVIDFSQLRDGSPEWKSVRQQVGKAMEEYGCFEALYAGDISQDLRKSVFDGLKQIFDLPLPIKLRNKSDDSYHGYIGQHESVPLYESLGISNADTPGKIESFTNLLWSQGNSELRYIQMILLCFSTGRAHAYRGKSMTCLEKRVNNFKTIKSFSEDVAKLDKVVRRMVLETYGLEKYMNDHIDSTNDIIRVNKYDAPHNNANMVGLTPHTDKNILSALCQNEVNGLQILTKDNKWIDANPSPGSLIIMAGESFHAWTNGRVHAPQHRVMMEGDVDRYSVGFFSIPKEGYIISAPEEMVDEEHPLLFKPFDNIGYLKFFEEHGIGLSEPMKAYCGA